MTRVQRTFQCSCWRAIQEARKLPPDTVLAGVVRAGDLGSLLDRCQSIIPESRICALDVDLDPLSPLARELALHTATPLNRTREKSFRFATGRTRRQVERPSAETLRAEGVELYEQPHTVLLYWPCLHDDETGEAFYERSARLVELFKALIQANASIEVATRQVNRVRRWTQPWTVQEALRASGY